MTLLNKLLEQASNSTNMKLFMKNPKSSMDKKEFMNNLRSYNNLNLSIKITIFYPLKAIQISKFKLITSHILIKKMGFSHPSKIFKPPSINLTMKFIKTEKMLKTIQLKKITFISQTYKLHWLELQLKVNLETFHKLWTSTRISITL